MDPSTLFIYDALSQEKANVRLFAYVMPIAAFSHTKYFTIVHGRRFSWKRKRKAKNLFKRANNTVYIIRIILARKYPQLPELAKSSSYKKSITTHCGLLDKSLTNLWYTQGMIDVHCHLNFHAFEKDYDDCIKEAQKAGVNYIINVGTKLDSSAKAIALAQKYNNLYAIVGVHPHHADKIELKNEAKRMEQTHKVLNQVQDDKDKTLGRIKFSEAPIAPTEFIDNKSFSARGNEENFDSDRGAIDSWLKELEILARQPKVVGIGEIGMDYFKYQSNGIVDPELQKEVFEAQIELAHRVGLPIQIHNRHAGQDVLEVLNHHKNILKRDSPGMFHCFAGNTEVLKGALELGFYIGFDGNSTYPGLAPGETTTLSDIAKATPLDRIVTETDSPFLTPIPYRGSRNKPSHVILVGKFLAELKGISFEELDRQTELNAKKLFGVPQ